MNENLAPLPTLPFLSCGIQGNSPGLSEPQSPHLQGNYNKTHPTRLL